MSNNNSYVPLSASHFALMIVSKFKLDKGGSILFIEHVIEAALRDAKKAEREREEVGCAKCHTLMLRYQTIREEFRDSCPQCREPMRSILDLDRKRVVESDRLGNGGRQAPA